MLYIYCKMLIFGQFTLLKRWMVGMISYGFCALSVHIGVLVYDNECKWHAMYILHTLNHWDRNKRRHLADDILKCIFLNENVCISLKISLKFVPKVRINNIPVLVQIMAWRRPGDKSLSEPMMDNLLTDICVTRPQLVNEILYQQ